MKKYFYAFLSLIFVGLLYAAVAPSRSARAPQSTDTEISPAEKIPAAPEQRLAPAPTPAPDPEPRAEIPAPAPLPPIETKNLNAASPNAVARPAKPPAVHTENKKEPKEIISDPMTAPTKLVVTAAPTSLPEPKPEEPPQRSGDLSVAGLFSSLKLASTDSATGASANLVSDLNFGVDVSWQQNWSKTFSTGLEVSETAIKILSPTNKSIDNANLNVGSMHLFGVQNISEHFFVGERVGYAQNLFLLATGVSVLHVDSIFVPNLGLELGLRSVLKPFTLKFTVGAANYFSAAAPNFDIQSGQSYYGNFGLSEEISAWSLKGELSVENLKQTTSISQENNSSLKLLLGFSRHF